MTKLIDLIKNNKKIIIIAIIIVILISIVFFINASSTNEESSNLPQKTQTEIKLTEILSCIKGVGETDVMISEIDGDIMGVVIVCQGADSITIKNDILNAVSTALCINKNLIAIYSMSI